jgi:hypothetical protein
MRRLLLGVPLIVGLGVSATHATAETISEGMNSPTFGVFSQGSLGGGSWSGEIQSQGMMMSNGIIYSQGMEIPDFSGEGPPIATDTSDVSSPHGDSADTMNYLITDISSPHGGSDVSGGGGSDVSGSVDNNPSPSTDPFSPRSSDSSSFITGIWDDDSRRLGSSRQHKTSRFPNGGSGWCIRDPGAGPAD